MKQEISSYFKDTRDLFNSIVMVCPLLILYELGLLFIDINAINGVDFFTLILCEIGREAFIIFNLALIIFFIGAIIYLSKKKRFHIKYFLPAIVESAIYAVATAYIIAVILHNTGVVNAVLLSADKTAGSIHDYPPMTRIIISFGAGVYEEFFFRLFLFGGLFALLRKHYKMEKFLAFLIACLVSSVLFSIAHYFGGEPATVVSFMWRLLAGILLVLIFHFRSFAIAVYTHTLYNIFVCFFARG
jgi:membrane protease YdiL (CAAX protease family)